MNPVEKLGHCIAIPVQGIALLTFLYIAHRYSDSQSAFWAGWCAAFGAWSTHRLGLIPKACGFVRQMVKRP